MKRLLSVLLIISLILGCVSALAEDPVEEAAMYVDAEPVTSGDYSYIIRDDGTIGITEYSGSVTDLVIPDEIDGKKVTWLMSASFADNSDIKSVVIPGSITHVFANPFAACANLSSILVADPDSNYEVADGALFCKEPKRLITYLMTNEAESYDIPDGTYEIGSNVFYANQAIKTVSIPDSVEVLNANPFTLCLALTTIKISPDNPRFAIMDGVMFRKEDKALVSYPDGLTQVSYTVPQGIINIGDGAFAGATALKSIILPESVVRIGIGVFAACSSLESSELPAGLTCIGNGAFGYCQSLRTITIPDSVTEIGEEAFAYCDQLIITVSRDSYAAQYCKENNLNYTYPDANNWLNQ